MAPAGEMAQLVTLMSGQNSLCRDMQQDYTFWGMGVEENPRVELPSQESLSLSGSCFV